MDDYMLSTEDNPFNPYTQWDEWYAYDYALGYHTPSYLARVVATSFELSEADQELAIKQGIDEILEMNLSGKHIKVPNPENTPSPQ